MSRGIFRSARSRTLHGHPNFLDFQNFRCLDQPRPLLGTSCARVFSTWEYHFGRDPAAGVDEKEETLMLSARSPWLRGRQHRVIAATLVSLLSVATSASAQNTFPASGNVGVGTTSPGTALDVQGTEVTGRIKATSG